MKDGRTRFTYKAEHTIDLDSDLAVTAEIYPGDTANGESMLISTAAAQETFGGARQRQTGRSTGRRQGYHKIESLAVLREVLEVRTFIPERQDGVRHNWRDRPEGDKEAFYLNRRRMQRARGRALSRLRSEYVVTCPRESAHFELSAAGGRGLPEGSRDEAEAVHRGADHPHPKGGGGRGGSERPLSQARHVRRIVLHLAAKYGGMDVSEAKRLRTLEDENRKLKQIVAEQSAGHSDAEGGDGKTW